MISNPTKYRHAKEIFTAGLTAVAPDVAVKRIFSLENGLLSVDQQVYDLDKFTKILVIGAGKGSALMAKAVESIVGERITAGCVSVKYGYTTELKRIEICEAGHPLPDQNGLANARRIFKLVSSADADTLVLCLISGGGSALLPLPAKGISLSDKQKTTELLLTCGATIHEINTIRKHVSAIKGGRLAKAAYPATLISLVLSDVIGDDLESIASGPCVADSTKYADCCMILEKYAIESKIPQSILRHITSGQNGHSAETPKPDDVCFLNTQNTIVANNRIALLRAKKAAEQLGYHVLLFPRLLEGEASVVAADHIAYIKDIQLNRSSHNRPVCLLSGGETTVTITGAGKGGRNQEFALAAALELAEIKNITLLSAGTDGSDGPTDAAGAFVDETTVFRAQDRGLDPQKYLDNNDSYNFFSALGDLYKIGPTNTNVMDLQIALIS
jgi:hydroxypyruvate reductase